MTDINTLKKISTKTMGFTSSKQMREVAATGKGAAVPLYRVIGIGSGVKRGVSDFGEWSALTGMFEATNIHTGEVFSAAVCFLPRYAQEIIEGALAGNPDNTVQLACDVCVQESDIEIGFEYTVTFLSQQDQSALDAIRADLPDLPALPAPAKK